jgi:uncharacterized membrane-anchored protein YitT (DUF2179 family)
MNYYYIDDKLMKKVLNRIKKRKLVPKINNENIDLFLNAFNFRENELSFKNFDNLINTKLKTLFKNLILIFFSAFSIVFAYRFFISKAGLYTTGLSSIAQLLSKKVNIFSIHDETIRFFLINFLFNVPIIIWGFLKIGIRFSLYTIIYIFFQNFISILFDFLPTNIKNFNFFNYEMEKYQNYLFMNFIYASFASLIYGTGLGLLYKTGGSSGGTDFIASYISLKKNYSIASLLRSINIVLLLLTILFEQIYSKSNDSGNAFTWKIFSVYFKETNVIFTLFFSIMCTFFVNWTYPKFMLVTVFIICEEINLLKAKFYDQKYKQGGNIWNIKGMYSNKDYHVIMTTMSLLEYNNLKNKIQLINSKITVITVSTKELLRSKKFK